MLLPILGRAKAKAQRTACCSNLRQLGIAWWNYSGDNNGLLAESYPTNNPDVWVQGDMSNFKEATNTSLICAGKLYHYNRSVALYHCPTDPGKINSGGPMGTVRSYSMSCFMGGRPPNAGVIPDHSDSYVQYFTKDADIPRPAQLWVLVDEDERSINDGYFVTDPNGLKWIDLPAISKNRHDCSYPLAFADGHAEIWRLRDARTFGLFACGTEQAGNSDLGRLAAAATVKR